MNHWTDEMNQQTIVRDFQIVAESPGGVDGMRRLILTLGITGRLTTPSDDEQTSEISYDLEFLGLRNERIWGVESTEAFPSTWVRLPLAKLGTWGSGGTPTRGNKEFYDGNIPWLVIGDLNDGIVLSATNSITEEGLRSSSATMIPVGAVLIAMYGSIGKLGIAGVSCTTNQAIAHCVPDERIISTAYLFQLMRGSRSRLISQGRGLAQKNISQTVLKHLVVAVPPLAEQQRIVANVEELMTLCDQLEEAKTKRDNIRTAARGSAIDSVATASTSQELDKAWKRISSNWDVVADTPESVEDLRRLIVAMFTRPLPGSRGKWVNRSLSSLVQILNGDRSSNYPSKEKRVRMGIPFINAGHLKSGQVNMENMDYITIERFNLLKGGKIEQGDVLFCLRGSLGKCALVEASAPGTIASSLAILRPNKEILPRYLLRFLQSDSCKRQIKQHDNGSAQPNLAAKSILKFEIELPSLPEQEMIVAEIDSLMALCDQLEEQLKSRNTIAKKFARSVTASEYL